MRRRSDLALSAILLAGCSGEPSHIPPLWQLPGATVSSAFENARYDVKRSRVKELVSQHRDTIAAEIDAGGGAQLTEVMEAAGVPDVVRPTLLAELQGHPEIYREGRGLKIEPVTVALMVHGN